jgi:hypothetical protein
MNGEQTKPSLGHDRSFKSHLVPCLSALIDNDEDLELDEDAIIQMVSQRRKNDDGS